MYVNKVGTFLDMFEVYAHVDVPANILCMGDMEDEFKVVYKQGVSYTLLTPKGNIRFKRVGKVYKTNIKNLHHVENYTISTNNLTSLTKQQVKQVRTAVDLWKRTERPGIQEFKRLVRDLDTNINNEDIDLAVKVHGLHDHTSIQEKATRWKAGEVTRSQVHQQQRNTQNMLCDVVYIYRENPILTTLSRDLNLLQATALNGQTAPELKQALSDQIGILKGKGFKVRDCWVDPQSGLKCLKGHMGDVDIRIGGAGDHLPALDVRVRRVQEICRIRAHECEFTVPKCLSTHLYKYAISRANTRVSSGGMNEKCPITNLDGRIPSLTLEFALQFGDYCSLGVTAVPKDVLAPRGIEGIALYPAADVNHTWMFLNINTGKVISRSRWTKLDMPMSVSKLLTNLDKDKGKVDFRALLRQQQQLSNIEAPTTTNPTTSAPLSDEDLVEDTVEEHPDGEEQQDEETSEETSGNVPTVEEPEEVNLTPDIIPDNVMFGYLLSG